jgi:hypothetical protein
MAEPIQVYAALRKRPHFHQPRTAPIAAIFEKCRESFERLCIVTRLNSSQPNSSLVEDNYGTFLAWGNDSGAATRSLDRTLRKTSNLSDMVMELLRTLYSTLQRGMLSEHSASLACGD